MMGAMNSPSDCRMPMVIMRMAAATDMISHMRLSSAGAGECGATSFMVDGSSTSALAVASTVTHHICGQWRNHPGHFRLASQLRHEFARLHASSGYNERPTRPLNFRL